jgi:hypothetical protein
VPPLYSKVLTDELTLRYNDNSNLVKGELSDNILSSGAFSITLDAWTAINQKAYLGITM